MTDTHFEPFLDLADVGPDRALVTWGGFWFHRGSPAERWSIVDDEQLKDVDPGRQESIGARSEPYGDAQVEVSDASGTVIASARTAEVNHVWVTGLRPDTAYRYRVLVDGEEWVAGERWDWGRSSVEVWTCDRAAAPTTRPSGRTRTQMRMPRWTSSSWVTTAWAWCRTRRAAAARRGWPRCSTGWSTGTASGW
jgi:hypothetical protein